MKQLLQNLKTGEAKVADVPVPAVQPGRVLVRTAASLISAGTERALTELGQKSLLGKARGILTSISGVSLALDFFVGLVPD